MPEFYIEGHTAERAPYGPVFVVETDDEGMVVDEQTEG